jgi:hypothetical protein
MTPAPIPSADRLLDPAGRHVGSGATNAVVLALVRALLDLEQRRTRGTVRPPMDERRIA